MAAPLFGWNNWLLEGSLVAGSANPSYPAENLRRPHGTPSNAWRTLPGDIGPLRGAWLYSAHAAPRPWRVLGLFRTNLSPAASVRWRVGSRAALVPVLPTYDWNWAAGAVTLPAGFTWNDRGDDTGCSTLFDENGDLQIVAGNAPRIHYDPVTFAREGLLFEPTRTNSVRNARMRNAVVGTPGTAPTNMGIAAGGGLSWAVAATGTENNLPYVDIRVTGTAAGGNLFFWFETNAGIPAVVDEEWTLSAFTRIVDQTAGSATTLQVACRELVSGTTILGTQTAVVALPDDAPLSANRRHASFTVAQATTSSIRHGLIYIFANGTTDMTFRFAGPQAELGDFVTNLMLQPEGVSNTTVTRSADGCSLVLTGDALAGAAASFGFYYEVKTTGITDNGGFQSALQISNGTTNERVWFAHAGTATPYTTVRVRTGATDTWSPSFWLMPVPVDSAVEKFAGSFRANDHIMVKNGQSEYTQTSGPYPVGLDRFQMTNIVHRRYIRRVQLFFTDMTNGQAIGLASTGEALDQSGVLYDSAYVGVSGQPGVQQTLCVLPQELQAEAARVDIADVYNPDNYIEVALAYFGPAWQPTYGLGIGSSQGFEVNVEDLRTRGGQSYPTLHWSARRWEVSLSALRNEEFWPYAMELARYVNLQSNVLFVPDAADEAYQEEAIFGLARLQSNFEFLVRTKQFRSMRFQITERL
jgi:hypothetical protein